MLNTWFWKRWIVSIFSWLVQTQSCIPYVQTGLMTWLYKRILFFVDRTDFLPMSQYILDNFRSSSARYFFRMCSFHLSLTSSVIPRYLAVFECGTTMWSIYTFWCVIFKFEKSTCIDLELFSCISHSFVQLQTLSIADCRTRVDFSTASSTANRAVLSANVAVK